MIERMNSFLIEKFNTAMKRAKQKGHSLANAFSLATVSPDGKPSNRMLLLKGVDLRGFVFYTNLKSKKAADLLKNPNASMCFWWPQIEEQIRIEGKVELITDQEADQYFATRPRGSQIGAWASEQSEKLSSRWKLIWSFIQFYRKFAGKNVPRPSHWSGFVLIPDKIEFWYGKQSRLHDRILYVRTNQGWQKSRLYP